MGALGIRVKVESEVVLPDGTRISGGGSPTITLRQHVVSELFAPIPTAVVQPVDRVCVVSVGGTLEDCTTSFSWSRYPYGTTSYVVYISGYVTVSGSYMVGYVRIKAGDVVYFESGVSSPFYVFPGQVVFLVIALTFSTVHSPSVVGGLPGITDVDSAVLLELLADILGGARPVGTYLTLERVRWEDEWGETILDVPLARSYSPGAISGSAFHDFANFVASGNLYGVFVDCVGRQYCLSYYLSSSLSVTTADRARFSVFMDAGYLLGLDDSVDLSLSDDWDYGFAMVLDLVDSVDVVLSDSWGYVFAGVLSLSDGVDVLLSDSWGYVLANMLDLSDGVGLSLVDGWSYGLASNLGLDDSVGLGLSDGWSFSVLFGFGLSDSVGLSLIDDWSYYSTLMIIRVDGVVMPEQQMVVDVKVGGVVVSERQVVGGDVVVGVVTPERQVVSDIRFVLEYTIS